MQPTRTTRDIKPTNQGWELPLLRPKQVVLLVFLQEYREQTLGSPSFRECAKACKFNSAADVQRTLRRLRDLGLVQPWKTDQRRAVKLTLHADKALRAYRASLLGSR